MSGVGDTVDIAAKNDETSDANAMYLSDRKVSWEDGGTYKTKVRILRAPMKLTSHREYLL